jgi:NRAMP (natural resistance-associated macrophage protein)-like metal ion transporter
LGPGLITGAADDDPSGIATYSQAGAQFGYQLLWTMILSYPLMVAIQEISAQIGRATGRGIAANLRERFPGIIVLAIVALLFVANVCNIGADLAAMAAAAGLLLPEVPNVVYLIIFAVVCAGSAVFFSHDRYVAILKWLTLSLFAYFGSLALAHVRWQEAARGLIPSLSLHRDAWLMLVAILGTTISPYLFFWQAGQEVEETNAIPQRQPLRLAPQQAPSALGRIRLDTRVGMGVSNLVALAIMVTTAATLNQAGMHEIRSAAQAASALRPLAGDFAFALFALGIIGTGLLSVPILAGSAAYALGEARRWPVGLARRPNEARAFYGALVLATLLGVAANIARLNPVKALIWSAVLNALVSVPAMVLILLIASDSKVMGQFTIGRRIRLLGWCAAVVMAFCSAIFLWTSATGNG